MTPPIPPVPPPSPADVKRELEAVLGPATVAASEAAIEMRKFASATKSMAARQKQLGERLIASGIPLVKFAGTITKTLSSYNANISIAKKQQETNQQKLAGLEDKRNRLYSELLVATGKDRQTLARKLQSTVENIEATKLNTEEQRQTIKAMKSARLGEVMQQTAKSMKETGQSLSKFTNSLNKTQKDFGIGMGAAATLKVDMLMSTVQDTADILSKIDLGAAFSALGDISGGIAGGLGGLFTGEGVKGFAESIKSGFEKANEAVAGPNLNQRLLPSERLAGIKAVQDTFGVMNKTLGESLAQTAKNYGVSVEQLVQARRTFATIARGDLSQVDKIQTRFFDEFSKRGMTPKVALEAIGKYADLIARNGTRFADSFARAAAEAKKIGVDLGKVDQVGDSIIDNFEGFLESQAELGAMGFGFDTSRLAEMAITGDTGALQTELRSQLANMGKDITQLNRAERLSLENALGMDIGELQRLAGGTPQISPEEISKDNNTKLTQLLVLAQTAGPLLGPMAEMAKGIVSVVSALGPFGTLASLVLGIGLWLKYKGDQDKIEREKLKERGKLLLEQGNISEGSALLREYARKEGAVELFRTGPSGIRSVDRISQEIEDVIANAQVGAMIKSAEARKASGEVIPALDASSLMPMGAGPRAIGQNTFGGFSTGTAFTSRTTQLTNEAIRRGIEYQQRNAVKKASGGPVTGPGTGTSDSIPAMLSNGEYVLPASVVSKIGVKNLDRLRSGMDKIDYAELMMLVMQGNVKGALGKAGDMGIDNTLTGALRLGAMEAMLVASAGKEVYDTYAANKDKPHSTYFRTYNFGTEEAPWVTAIKKRRGMKDGGLVGRLKSTAMSKGMDFLSNRIPGFGMGMGLLQDYRQGGVGGALKSAMSGGLGKFIGGALGSAIPIPGVGTAIGSLMGSKVGKLVGGLFGRKKQPVAQQIMGALPEMGGFAGNLMGRIPGMERFNPEALFRNMAGQPQAQAAVQAVVDTTGIEQKLNNFISALNNINIVMDGAKVGKALVNVTDAASTVGVFRPTTRATL